MKILLMLTAGFSVLFSGGVLAQTFTLYAPPERDFRVMFPGTPTRLNAPSGSVEFRTESGTPQFSVFRHDPRRITSAATAYDDIVKRNSTEDLPARRFAEDDTSFAANEYVFRVGATWSVHRVVLGSGRAYELVVTAPADDGIPRQVAQDFFNSFQMGGVSGFPVFANLPAPDSCRARDNAFARRLCEYLTCQVAGYENHPACAGIPRFLKN